MHVTLDLRPKGERPLAKKVPWQDGAPLPKRHKTYLVEDLGHSVKVSGVTGLSGDCPRIILTLDTLGLHTTHRLQSLGWRHADS